MSELLASPPETILFVEDEPILRVEMTEFLRDSGYRVHEAATANEAIEALEAIFAIDVVFTDVNLSGGMDGLELADWTFQQRPGVKVLVITGDASRMADIPQTVEALLAKPYTGHDLLDRVHQAMTKQLNDDGTAAHTG